MRDRVRNKKDKKNKIKIMSLLKDKNLNRLSYNLANRKVAVQCSTNSLIVDTNCYKKYAKKRTKEYHAYRSSQSTWSTAHQRLDKISRSNNGNDIIRHKVPFNTKTLRRQRAEEIHIYGENSCRALFQQRPESIIRAWCIRNMIVRFKEVFRYLSKKRRAYHIVNTHDLFKITGTKHHGGICFLVKKRDGINVHHWINRENTDDCIIALENVGNPHNLGAIMRSCAHFSIKSILLQDVSLLESGSAIRTAEGGAEYIQPITEKNIIKACEYLRKSGYAIVTTSSHKGTSLFEATLPRKMVLVLGQECNGLSEAMLSLSDLKISIDGTGNIESLNISVATGILLSEWWRQSRKCNRIV